MHETLPSSPSSSFEGKISLNDHEIDMLRRNESSSVGCDMNKPIVPSPVNNMENDPASNTSPGKDSAAIENAYGLPPEAPMPPPPPPAMSPILMKKLVTPVTLRSRKRVPNSKMLPIPILESESEIDASNRTNSGRSTRSCRSSRSRESEPAFYWARNKSRRKQTIRAPLLRELDFKFTPPVIEKDGNSEEILRLALKNNFVFERLEPSALKQLVQAFEPTPPFQRGDVIVRQGEKGDYFYILESGEVSFGVNGKLVSTMREPGSSFGELELLYTSPRASTVMAVKTTRLWRLEQKVFRYVLQSQTRESKTSKYRLLRNIDFFSQMERSDVRKCVNVMTPRRYVAGEVIAKKGDAGDAFYVVASGELQVSDFAVGDTEYEDVTLKKGDYFGERALMKSEPQAANLIGLKEGTLFSIDRVTFEIVCGSFVRLILKSQDKSRLSGLKVIKAAKLLPDAINDLLGFLEDEIYEEGEAVFLQGEATTPAVYFVREGKFQITHPNGTTKLIKEGGYFGEDQLLADAKGFVSDLDGSINASYSATALDEGSICGVLTLEDCRNVFDTNVIPITKEFSRESFIGMTPIEESEFSSLCRRTSLRSVIDKGSFENGITRESLIGEGQYGEVWEISHFLEEFNDRSKFALKIQSKEDDSRAGYTAIEGIQRECDILASLEHPHIVDLIHHYEDEENIYMVMGIIPGGDLWSLMHYQDDNGEWQSGMPESKAKFYALILADTLDFLHGRMIVYRDLKPENVMIDEKGYPVLVDFGYAKVLHDGVTFTFCGTPQYLCPEIAESAGHGLAVDHWALGVVIYEMVSGESPFFYDDIDNATLLEDICKNEPHPLPSNTSEEAVDLVGRLLEKDPTRRIGSLAKGGREIKMHPWFEGLDLQKVRRQEVEPPFVPTLDS